MSNILSGFRIQRATVEDVESIFKCKRLRVSVGDENIADYLSLEFSPCILQFNKYKMLFTAEALPSPQTVELHACFPRSSIIGSRALLLGLMLYLSNLGIKIICIPVKENNLILIRNSLSKLGFIEVDTVEGKTFFMINLGED